MSELRTATAHVTSLALILMAVSLGAQNADVLAAVPEMIDFQGVLTDAGGNALPSGPKTFTFRIYDGPTNGSLVWPTAAGEVQVITTTSQGLWVGYIGAIVPLTDAVFSDTLRWLEITVNDGVNPQTVLPRVRLVTGPYALRVATVDGASGGTITSKVAIGPGHTNTGIQAFVAGEGNNASGGYSTVGGGGGPAEIEIDGITFAGGANTAYTPYSTVGGGASNYAGSNLSYEGYATVSGGFADSAIGHFCTVGGGGRNKAIYEGATVGGGSYNTASGYSSTIGGGTENTVSASYAAIGGGSTNTASSDAATVGGGSGNTASGNTSTIGGGTGNTASGDYSTVGGGFSNASSGGVATVGGGQLNKASDDGATVGGGYVNVASGFASTVAGGYVNTASNEYATVGGGVLNFARGLGSVVAGGGTGLAGDSNYAVGAQSTVSGGANNGVTGTYATVSGGLRNLATAEYSRIGGGRDNSAEGYESTISGGASNRASGSGSSVIGGWMNAATGTGAMVGGAHDTATGSYSVIAGGDANRATGNYSLIPGGSGNKTSGHHSLAAGHRAEAAHNGAFVWADSYDGVVSSSASDQFTARASGGVRFFSNTALTAGVTLAPGGGSWASVSDRNVKQNIEPVDGQAVLTKLASLFIAEWNYTSQDDSIRHIGPMAQDFYAAFGVGEDDKHITTIDADGVALAAIQALHRKNRELEDRIAELEDLIEHITRDVRTRR